MTSQAGVPTPRRRPLTAPRGPPGVRMVIVRSKRFTESRDHRAKGGTVNKDQIKGKIEEIKGDVKERIGGASKDRSTQAEGWMENKKGKLREGFGDAKEDLERERTDPDRDR